MLEVTAHSTFRQAASLAKIFLSPASLEADALAPGDYEGLSGLRYALNKFTEFSIGEALKLGLTPQQHQALLAIKGLPPESERTTAILAERRLPYDMTVSAPSPRASFCAR